LAKKLIVVLILVIVLAVAAFAAYTLFIKENTAKSLQPSISSFPAGWERDDSYSVSKSNFLGTESYSRERFVVTGSDPLRFVVIAINVHPSNDKALESFNGDLAFFGPGTAFAVPGLANCFRSASGDLYFQQGRVSGQFVISLGTFISDPDITNILTDIANNIAKKT